MSRVYLMQGQGAKAQGWNACFRKRKDVTELGA